ncbi:MAG TPA: hypothetical protein VFI95_15110 [Terriglobales bacterium]|nr:hypothetical protein [Terriglobales bacterium]
MNRTIRFWFLPALTLFLVSYAVAQAKPDEKQIKTGVQAAAEVKTVMPTTYFYDGMSSSVQLRNSAAFRTKEGHFVLAGLVDTSGYSSGVRQKYQGLFITELKLDIEGSELSPGQYGFGFTDDKFVITDVGGHDVLSVPSKTDDQLKRAVPLKIKQEGDAYRLYAGKKYVTVKAP